MKSYNKCSLSTQLVIVLLLVFVAAIILLGVYDYHREINSARAANSKNISAIAHSISVAITEDVYTDDYMQIEKKLLALSDLKEIASVTLFDARGMILSDMVRQNNGKLQPTYHYGLSSEKLERELMHYNDDNSLISVTSIYFSGRLLGWLKIESSSEIVNQATKQFFYELVTMSVVLLFVVIMTASFFMRRRLRSLKYLVRFADLLPDARGARINDKNAPPEIKSLMKSLNWASQEIKRQHNKLHYQNWYLEYRVMERTRELESEKIKAEQASEAKTRFLSQMSHELRTPLNAIMGFAQLLRMKKSDLTSEQQSSVQEIYCAADHLLTMVNEILEISSIESGKLQINKQDHDVVEIIKGVVALIRPLANDKNISINCEAINNKTYMINSDPQRTRQVLLNVFSNAIKYNKQDGLIEVEINQTGEQTVVKVCDTGEGIVRQDRERIFESFERSPRSSVVNGAGIGLAISKQYMVAMGGEILLESEPGEGSMFILVFDTSIKQQAAVEVV